jgi:hypothetical protein
LFVLKGKLMGLRPAHLAVAVLAAFIGANNHAYATDDRSERSVEPTELGMSEEPIMAIVALYQQRISVYGANGNCSRAGLKRSTGTRDARRNL